MKLPILFVLISLCFVNNIFSQSDTVAINIHPIIGDTLDATENFRYKIFNEDSESFEYAVIVLIDGNVKAILNFENDSVKVIDYSIEKVMQIGTHIDNTSYITSDIQIENKDLNKSAKLRIVYNERKKRIRKHSRIRFILYNADASLFSDKNTESELVLAKLIQVNDTKEPSINVKLQQKGKPRITIPLSNIKMIRFNTPTENILNKVLSVTYFTICFFTTKASFSDPAIIPIAVASGVIGVLPFIKGNKRYDIGINSRFEIFY